MCWETIFWSGLGPVCYHLFTFHTFLILHVWHTVVKTLWVRQTGSICFPAGCSTFSAFWTPVVKFNRQCLKRMTTSMCKCVRGSLSHISLRPMFPERTHCQRGAKFLGCKINTELFMTGLLIDCEIPTTRNLEYAEVLYCSAVSIKSIWFIFAP